MKCLVPFTKKEGESSSARELPASGEERVALGFAPADCTTAVAAGAGAGAGAGACAGFCGRAAAFAPAAAAPFTAVFAPVDAVAAACT